MRRFVLIALLAWMLPGCCIDVPFVPFVVDPTVAPHSSHERPATEAP